MKAEMDKNGNLVITIPTRKNPKLSKSGKSFTLATTSGNKQTELEVDGEPVFIGVNAFYANEDYVPPAED